MEKKLISSFDVLKSNRSTQNSGRFANLTVFISPLIYYPAIWFAPQLFENSFELVRVAVRFIDENAKRYSLRRYPPQLICEV